MERKSKNDKEKNTPYIYVITDLEKEQIAFVKNGFVITVLPELPRGSLSLSLLRKYKNKDGTRLKMMDCLGDVYVYVANYKISHEVIFVDATGHRKDIAKIFSLSGQRILWLGPAKIVRGRRKIGCAFSLAAITKFREYCNGNGDKLLRRFGEELQNGSTL